jgi:hypothetical protein
MTKYVIGPDVAIRLAHDEAVIRDEHQILAPALLRSQLVSLLYQAVHRGELTKKDAERRLNYVRGLRIRLLGDRVLQNVAWKVADQLPRSQPRDLGLGSPRRQRVRSGRVVCALHRLGRHAEARLGRA